MILMYCRMLFVLLYLPQCISYLQKIFLKKATRKATKLTLFLKNLIVSGSPLHEFETCYGCDFDQRIYNINSKKIERWSRNNLKVTFFCFIFELKICWVQTYGAVRWITLKTNNVWACSWTQWYRVGFRTNLVRIRSNCFFSFLIFAKVSGGLFSIE